jgi:hypothetical protein
MLDSRELCVVVGNNPDPEKWKQPRVKIVADGNGKEIDGEMMDLADQKCGKAIEQTLDPNTYRIDVSSYFL